jgi:hypothetical protein
MSKEKRRAFLQNDPINVHNIVPQQTIKQVSQTGLAALLENVEIKATASSSYTRQNVDDRLNFLSERLCEIKVGQRAPDEAPALQEEQNYLLRLRERDFGVPAA